MRWLAVNLLRLAVLLAGAALTVLCVPVAMEPATSEQGLAAVLAGVGVAALVVGAGSLAFALRPPGAMVRRWFARTASAKAAQPHYACGSCGRDFSSDAGLERHRATAHERASRGPLLTR
jgi:hypothetical protein